MLYDIRASGDELSVIIPEKDLDRKALLSISQKTPEYLIPFNYEARERQIECTYSVKGVLDIYSAVAGLGTGEYAKLFAGLLSPLVESRELFMENDSFVFAPEFIYFDREKGRVKYLYIPSVKACSDKIGLRDGFLDIIIKSKIRDDEFRLKIVEAAVNYSSPEEFLRILKPFEGEGAVKTPGPESKDNAIRR
jgi:hypothetical protein